MSNKAVKQTGKSAKKPAAANVSPRQVKRTAPITPSAQTSAKPPTPLSPAPVEQRPKPLSTLMSTTALDGFSGFSEEVEGADRQQGGSVIQGTIVKFTSEGDWITGDGDELSSERELIPVDIVRVVQKWIDGKPAQTIIIPPGEKFPDVKAMNEAAPRSEWREDLNGNMVGPWQMQYLVYLLDAHTLDKFTFPTSTIGGGMACRALADKVAWARKYRGPKVSAVITLSDMFMNTKYGGRQRPHFQIVRWIGFDDGSETVVGAEAAASLPWKEVEEPSLQEEMADDLPDFAK